MAIALRQWQDGNSPTAMAGWRWRDALTVVQGGRQRMASHAHDTHVSHESLHGPVGICFPEQLHTGCWRIVPPIRVNCGNHDAALPFGPGVVAGGGPSASASGASPRLAGTRSWCSKHRDVLEGVSTGPVTGTSHEDQSRGPVTRTSHEDQSRGSSVLEAPGRHRLTAGLHSSVAAPDAAYPARTGRGPPQRCADPLCKGAPPAPS
jgi:hypothetical protein